MEKLEYLAWYHKNPMGTTVSYLKSGKYLGTRDRYGVLGWMIKALSNEHWQS